MTPTTIEWLASLEEPALRTVVVQLFRSIDRYEDVRLVHGPLEHGRDIVFAERTPWGSRLYSAIQVKAQVKAGSTGRKALITALDQCESALRHLYTTPDGSEVLPANVILAVGTVLTPYFDTTLRSAVARFPRISVLDGAMLADLVDKHAPGLVPGGAHTRKSYLKALTQYCSQTETYFAARFRAGVALGHVFVPRLVDVTVVRPSTVHAGKWKRDLSECFNDQACRDLSSSILAGCHFFKDLAFVKDQTLKAARYVACLKALGLTDLATRISDAWADLLDASAFSTGGTPIDSMLTLSSSVYTSDAAKHTLAPALKEYLKELKASDGEHRATRTELDTEAEENANTERFYALLRRCYISGEPANLAPTATDLRSRVVSQKHPPTAPVLTQLRTAVAQVLDAFSFADATLIDRYTSLWRACADGRQPNSNVTGALLAAPEQWRELLVLSTFLIDDSRAESPDVFRVSAEEGLRALRRAVLLGEMGTGKSTMLRRLCRMDSEAWPELATDGLPLFTALGSLPPINNSRQTVRDAILAGAVADAHEVHVTLGHSDHLYLDGLDEAAPAFQDLVAGVYDWLPAEHRVCYLSSRPSSQPPLSAGLAKVRMVPLGPEAVREFANAYPWSDPTFADEFTRVVSASPSLMELARVPIFLTLLALVADNDGPDNLPRRREGIYDKVVGALLSDWDDARRVKRARVIKDQRLRLLLLQEVAARMHEARRRDAELSVLAKHALQVSEQLTLATCERFVQELARDGVIGSVSSSAYSFAHLSLQEYLTALRYSSRGDLSRIDLAFRFALQGESWWQQVVVFYASIVRQVEPLIASARLWETASGRNPHAVSMITQIVEVADLTPWHRLSLFGDETNPLGNSPLAGLVRDIVHQKAADNESGE